MKKPGLNLWQILSNLTESIKIKPCHFSARNILEMSQEKGDLESKEYLEALKKSTGSRDIIHRLIEKNSLDAIASLTDGPAWCIDHVNGDYYNGFSFSTPAAISGFPHITVPLGTVFGLPVGFSFMGFTMDGTGINRHGLRF